MMRTLLRKAGTRSTLRRWGARLAVVIPPDAVKAEGLEEGDVVILGIRKARKLELLFGMFRGRPLDAQAIKDGIRREDSE